MCVLDKVYTDSVHSLRNLSGLFFSSKVALFIYRFVIFERYEKNSLLHANIDITTDFSNNNN